VYFKSKQDHLELTATMFHDELVERCKKGDTRSYETLYQQYSKAMFNTSLRIVNNASDAEDVLQEAFMDAFRFLGDFNYKSTFGAWLKRIVINKSINVLRKRKVDLVDIDTTPVADVVTEEVLDEENMQLKVAEVKKAVTLLPNGYRTVLTLYLFEGYDHEEIAEIMRISESTVRTQYHRAKHKLLHIIKGGLS
jgi:RNA polymerase sigma-70 factor (ECF subfamily)